jgi:hypothetical protein
MRRGEGLKNAIPISRAVSTLPELPLKYSRAALKPLGNDEECIEIVA